MPSILPRTLMIALLGASTAAPVAAQTMPTLRSGAWEITSLANSGTSAMEAQMAKMPPQAQEMMRKKMAQAAMSTNSIRHCSRPNDPEYARQFQSSMGMNIQCTMSNASRSGDTYKWQSRCTGTLPTGAPLASESSNTFVMQGDSAYEHTFTTIASGSPAGSLPLRGGNRGKYLGADCAAHGALTMEERNKQFDQARASREDRRKERIQMRIGKE